LIFTGNITVDKCIQNFGLCTLQFMAAIAKFSHQSQPIYNEIDLHINELYPGCQFTVQHSTNWAYLVVLLCYHDIFSCILAGILEFLHQFWVIFSLLKISPYFMKQQSKIKGNGQIVIGKQACCSQNWTKKIPKCSPLNYWRLLLINF
jgi:hypothetical protein